MSDCPRTLIVIATYNEIENLPRLIEEIGVHAPQAEILVIDDNSPDGTGDWFKKQADGNPTLHFIGRPSKLGLGTATIAGFRYALEHHFALVLTMDADFSHQPRFLPDLINPLVEGGSVSVMIGSRYVTGGGVRGWPFHRRLMSRAVNTYATILLGLPVRDASGAFRCYTAETLRSIDFEQIRSHGYSYLEEILWRLKLKRATFRETPIVFIDREAGQTKINAREAVQAIWIITRLGIRNWCGW